MEHSQPKPVLLHHGSTKCKSLYVTAGSRHILATLWHVSLDGLSRSHKSIWMVRHSSWTRVMCSQKAAAAAHS
eukprot:4386839-Amphidinium_carterae.2